MNETETGSAQIDIGSVRKARARAVAMTASMRGVVDAAVIDEHLKRYLEGGADQDFLRELIEGKVLGARGVRELLTDIEAGEGGPADPRATLVVPLASVEGHAPEAFSDDDYEPIGFMSTDTVSGSAPQAKAKAEAPEGYEFVRPLGLGGMGEVIEVRDTRLLRHAALKRIRADRRDPIAERMFLQEAQVTAQLEHPNIPPIHHFGRLPTGEPYFTMKRVQGRTLRAQLRRRAHAEPTLVAEAELMQLGLLFLQVLQALSYAHARGVVHCDLKPENILVGEHGEVLVMDWGLASLTTATRGERLRLSSEVITRGSGTPPYMSAEQLIGDVVDARSDVYALGVVLFELLCGQLPYGEDAPRADLLVRMLTQGPPTPRSLANKREIDDEIERICMKAIAPRAEQRYADAEQMRVDVEQWLTGAQRRKLAAQKFREGEQKQAHLHSLRKARAALETERARLAADVKPYDPPEKKAALWQVEDRVFALDVESDQMLADAFDSYSRAVGVDAGFEAAADRLADLHVELFLAAEAVGDRRAELLHRRAIERHHRGRHAAVLAGTGTLTLLPQDPDVTVTARQLVEHGRRIVGGPSVALPARIERLSLPIGSYLFSLRAPGRAEAHVHVLVERGGDVVLHPRLFTGKQIGGGFVHVPAGPFVYGGDPHALNAGPREVRVLDDFAIAEVAVTCEQYLEFLNAQAPETAAPHVPRTRPDGGFLWQRGSDGRFFIPDVDADGNPAVPRAPVMGVSFDDAQAYAAWRSTRDGVRYRLPTEYEWEKAARGADGRAFPWGNGFDATFCKMALSRPGRPQPEPVGAFPVDTSVYGVRDCAGSIREWCDSFYDETRETRVLRGGAWYFNAAYCRVAFRHGYLPHIVFTNFGIRLAKSL